MAAWIDYLPLGLVVSVIVVGSTLAVALVGWNFRWLADNRTIFAAHVAAGLCIGWSLIGHAIMAWRPRFAASTIGRNLLEVLQIMQLTLGLVAVIILFHLALSNVFFRVPLLSLLPEYNSAIRPSVPVPLNGLIALGLVAGALALSWWRTGNLIAPTCLLWLGVLASLWGSLQIPDIAVRRVGVIVREVWVDWVSPFVLGTAVTLFMMVGLRCWVVHRQRVTAWPDRLDDLLRPPPPWPGFRYFAGIIASMVLILGCIMITSPLTPISAGLAGVAMLLLAHQRWEENLADAALGLITLGVLSLLMWTVPYLPNKSEHFAAIYSRAVLGLAIMTAFWHWLADVWGQQLDQGQPWTTAGRLIRPCRRVGFLVGVTGTLVAMHLAFWPKYRFVAWPDNTFTRWLEGIVSNLFLIAALARATLRTRKSTLAWVTFFAVASLVAFVVIRLGGGILLSFLLRYWPLLLVATSAVLLVPVRLCLKSPRIFPFFEPLYSGSILLLPMMAIWGALLVKSHVFPLWIASATFAALAGMYLLATFIVGPRGLILFTLASIVAGVVAHLQ